MTITFHPTGLLVTAVFLVLFGALLALATNVETALSGAGLISIAAYVVIEVFGSFNPAIWWRERRTDTPDSTQSRHA
jgi:hypothetical protein